MRFLDYLPHRLLANYSLKREAQKVNDRYEEVVGEIESKRRQNKEEIEKAREIANTHIQEAVHSLNDQLNQHADALADRGADLCEYARLYFEQGFLNTKLNGIIAEKKIVQEYIFFLTQQMTIVGNEIATLEERKAILSQQVDVSDILRLLRLSGADIDVNDEDSAETLLAKVSLKASVHKKDFLLRNTLKRLERLVQDREELLSLIQYIDWIIEQKKRLSKEWKALRSNLREESDAIDIRMKECQEEQGIVEDQMDSQARKIRAIWATPLLYLSADLTEKKSERDALLTEVREHNDDIQKMKDAHSSDSDRWDCLHREKEELKEKLTAVNQEIKRIEGKQHKQKANASSIYDLCKKIGTPLVVDGKEETSDEFTILVQRLTELKAIEDEGAREAEAVYDAAKQKLISEKDALLSDIQTKIDEAKARYAAIKNLVQHKTSCLGMVKKKDKESRSFFARLFKKSEEIERAEEELDKLRHELSKAYDAWKSLLKSKEEQAVYYDNAISAVRKVYNRPTYSERKEMKKLERHRDKLTRIYDARRKKKRESKN